jgi:hypothetical protein
MLNVLLLFVVVKQNEKTYSSKNSKTTQKKFFPTVLHSKREQRKFPGHIRPNSSPLPSIPTLPSVLFFNLISHALAQPFLKNNRKSAGFHPETSQIGHFSG